MKSNGYRNEFELRDSIFDLLRKSGIFCWKDRQVVGVPGKGTFRSSNGVSDILGIYQGRMLAVEVKMPKGRVSQDQQNFLEEVTNHGGIAMIARSVEEVIERLKAEKRAYV